MGWLASFTDWIGEVGESAKAAHYADGFSAYADLDDDRGNRTAARESREDARWLRHWVEKNRGSQ